MVHFEQFVRHKQVLHTLHKHEYILVYSYIALQHGDRVLHYLKKHYLFSYTLEPEFLFY